MCALCHQAPKVSKLCWNVYSNAKQEDYLVQCLIMKKAEFADEEINTR